MRSDQGPAAIHAFASVRRAIGAALVLLVCSSGVATAAGAPLPGTLSGLADLAPYTAPNWDNAIPIGTTQLAWDAVHACNGPYFNDQLLYFSWASINLGSSTATDYTVHVEVTGSGGRTWDWKDVTVAPGVFAHLMTDLSIGPLSAGTHTIKIWHDYTNVIAESDETNNYVERTITVMERPAASLPDLSSYTPPHWDHAIPIGITQLKNGDVHAYTGPYYSDQLLYFNWTSMNRGTATATMYTVHVEVTGSGGKTWDWKDVTTAPGAFARVITDLATGPLTPGTHTIKVWLDYTNVIAESDETNNYVERTITVLERSGPDLVSFIPSNWDSAIPVGVKQLAWDAAHDYRGPYYNDQTLYVNWASANSGTVMATGYTVRLEVTGGGSWTSAEQTTSAGSWSRLSVDLAVGPLTAGSHTLKVWLDPGNVVTELNESNNYFERTIIVTARAGADISIAPLELVLSNGPVISASGSDVTAASFADRGIFLQTGTITPSPNRPPLRIADAAAVPSGRMVHRLVQFASIPTVEERIVLAAAGIRLLSYVADDAYWATIEARPRSSALSDLPLTITWLNDSSNVQKISPAILQDHLPPTARMRDGSIDVRIVCFEDAVASEARRMLASIDGVIVGEWESPHVLQAFVSRESLPRLNAIDFVEWIEPAAGPNKIDNATSSKRMRLDFVRNLPYAADGMGVTVGVWDEGAVFAHSDFGGRLSSGDGTPAISDHATHVAGTIGGSGAGDLSAKGMAPRVLIQSYDWAHDTNEMTLAAFGQTKISNHSYGRTTGWEWQEETSSWKDFGSEFFGLYESRASAWDALVASTNLMVFKSAGNDRNDGPDYPAGPRMDGPYHTISSDGNAKNIFTIGATTDTDAMTSFSSWGPSDDGRIKPDLVANGALLLSTLPGNTYGSFSGTSMASPSAAGAAAVLFQYYQRATGSAPSAATMKAVMIHGAKDLGPAGPDYQFGWGLIDAQRSAEIIRDAQSVTGSHSHGTTSYSIRVPGGAQTLKATLVWTDPPASPSAAVALQNDLDLGLRSPSGTLYRPWVLDSSHPDLPATTGRNHLDNVEQVLVRSPEKGDWTIEVSGTVRIGGPQAFTLVNEYLGSTFSIYNGGSSDLQITSIQPERSAPWISWSPAAPMTIAPGELRTITVRVDASRAPATQEWLRLLIHSNVAGKSPYPAGVSIRTGVIPLDRKRAVRH